MVRTLAEISVRRFERVEVAVVVAVVLDDNHGGTG